MADSVAKPGSASGAPASKSSTAPGPAPASATPATKAGGAPPGAPAAAGAKAGGAPPATPKPIAGVDDLIERAEDRLIPKGATVRLSPDHPDVASKARREELEDSLEACGIKIVWDKSLAKDAIVVEPAAKK